MRLRLVILISPALLALSLLAFAAPASATDFKCYCLYTKDGDSGWCDKGEVGLDTDESASNYTECSDLCGNTNHVKNQGTSDFFLLSQPPPNVYFNQNQSINHVLCYKNFTPPAGYSGTCNVVPKESPSDCSVSGTPKDIPCNVTIRTDALPDPTTFGDLYHICTNNCENQGNFLCHDPKFTTPGTPVPPAATPGSGSTSTPEPAHAGQGGTGDNQILSGSVLTLPLPLGNISLPDIIARVIKQVLSIVGALALLFFVWGGLKWMLARGAADEIAKAKKMIVAAISGLIAIFASYAILDLIIKNVAK